MDRTDLELLGRYANARDAEAFGELVARHRDMVYAACYRILGTRADAEDSVQECFLRLARYAASVKTSVAGWLHRVAVREALATRRRDGSRRQTEREAATMRPCDAAEPTWDDIAAEVDQAIDELPERLREPLVLHFLEGKPQTAIAEELGVSQPAVSMRINRGIERLRRHLRRTGVVLPAGALAALLSTHATEAAPPTLVASLGRIALAGVGSGPSTTSVTGTALGHTALAGSKAKIACVVVALLTVAAVVQQTVRGRSVERGASTTAQEMPTGAACSARPDTGTWTGERPAAHDASPAEAPPEPAPEPDAAVRIAQAVAPDPAADRQPHAATLSLSPTGAITVTDDEGLLATLWLIAFGTGWNPWDQRRHAEASLILDEPGRTRLTGQISMLQDDGGAVLFEQRLRRTETGAELGYDVTFNDVMTVKNVVLALRRPRERFAGESVALHTINDEVEAIRLPERVEGFRLGAVDGVRLDMAPHPEPLLTVGIEEPIPVVLGAQDLRPVSIDEYEVQIGVLARGAGEQMLPGDRYCLRLWLDFTGEVSLGAVLPPECIVRPGVKLCRDGRVDESLCEGIADVVSAAKRGVEGLFPHLAKEEIRVYVLPAITWHENVATNRRDAIYVRAGDAGIGEAMRADARPLGMLCQAVAELYNPRRVPGRDRFITHRHVAPAVRDQLGAGVVPARHPTPLADDGPEMLRVLTGATYTPLHPDFAAVKALVAIEDRLGFGGLSELLRGIPGGGSSAFAALQAAAIRRDPALAEAFAAHEEATDLEVDDDGTCLIASFELGDTVKRVEAHPLQSTAEDVVLVVSPEFEMSQSDEWAAHGTHSLRLHSEAPRSGIEASIIDPDWRFKDFGRFGAFEMDLMLLADEPQEVGVVLMDDVRGAHVQVPVLRGIVGPGQPTHVSCPLLPGTFVAQKHPQSECFSGPFRINEISCVYVHLPDPTGRVTLFIDNLRLIAHAAGNPRPVGEAAPPAAVFTYQAAGAAPAPATLMGVPGGGLPPPPPAMALEMLAAPMQQPAPGGRPTIERPGVTVRCDEAADETLCGTIADVVSIAKGALERGFPHLGEKHIQVRVAPVRGGWYESTITDRRDTIYVQSGRKGIGEHFRADAGPLGLLCEAVAELYNPRRIPGLDRYLTHCHLVPAVMDELGPDPIPSTNATSLATDGSAMLEAITDEAYAPMHPDFAAVAALLAIQDKLGLEALKTLVAGLPQDAGDPFATLREGVVARDPTLAEAFRTYDEANQLELGDDGTCLIASFEEDEIVTIAGSHPLGALHAPLVIRPNFRLQTAQTDEWATDGTMSLKFQRDRAVPWITVGIWDPDWRFKDWRRFSRFDMDLMVLSARPERIRVRLHDDVSHGHGQVYLFNDTVRPGESVHISYPLSEDSLRGDRTYEAAHFDGRFRASGVTSLEVMFVDPATPVVLYIDNLRLTPRAVGGAGAPAARSMHGGTRPLSVQPATARAQ
jgi:RNA polymerase sigma factor (sigma-70 family)